jgi:HEAT repeat protein
MTAVTTSAKGHLAPPRISQLVLDLKNPDRSIREESSEQLSQNGTPENAGELCSYLYDDDITIRNLAAEILVKMGPIAERALLKEAQSSDSDVRKFAVDIMALIGSPVYGPTLCSLLDDSNENVVCSAAEALGRVRYKDSVGPLINCQKKHPYSEIQVIEALGSIGSNDALPTLYEKLQSSNVVLAFAAVEAVGNIGTNEALDKLFSLLNVKNLSLRNAVLSTILKLAVSGNRQELSKASAGKFVDYLLEAANSDDATVRSSIVKELAFWNGENVVSALIAALTDPVPEIVDLACGALRINGDSGLKQIINGIKNGDEITQKHLLEISAFLKSSELLDVILSQAKSKSADVRLACASALAKYSDSRAVKALLGLIKDDVGHVRARALQSLGLIGDTGVVPKIYEHLNDEYDDVREACLAALILISGATTINLFKKDMDSADIEKRIMAVRALSWIGESDAAEVLVSALNNDEAEVRRYAILGLAKIGDHRLEENLTYLLTDENPEVRKAVIDAYLQVKPEKASANIQLLLDDTDMWVRFYAINALASICDESCLDKLVEIAHGQPPFVQIAIIGILAKGNNAKAREGLKSLAQSDIEDVKRAATEVLESTNGAR